MACFRADTVSSSIIRSSARSVWDSGRSAQGVSPSEVSSNERLGRRLTRRYPSDTLAQVAAATIRSYGLLSREKSRDGARQAIDALAPERPYMMSGNYSLVPAYVLGQAYLASGQSKDASSAFKIILDHTGVTRNYITGPLARLGLAKAEEEEGDVSNAKADYTEFLRPWSDADPEVLILRSAKRLQSKWNLPE
jgi:hypothetical protein